MYTNTNALRPGDDSYMHKPVHMITVPGFIHLVYCDGQSNKVVGIMMADHFLLLCRNKLPYKAEFGEFMED